MAAIAEQLGISPADYLAGERDAAFRHEYVHGQVYAIAVDVFRRNEHGRWELFAFSGETAHVSFASVDYTCTMRDLYEDVNFALDETN